MKRAMMGHQSELRALEDENKRLRAELESKREADTLRTPAPSPELREVNPAAHPGGDVHDHGHQGQVSEGAPQHPQWAGGEKGDGCEGGEPVRPPPGLGGRRDDERDHRGSSQVHGGDPAEDRPEQEGVDGGPFEKRGSQPEVHGRPVGLEGAEGKAPLASNGNGQREPKGSVDAFGLLAQGIAQLQNAMTASLSSKSQEQEVVKPGISELPRLPELSETSCIDIGDWIHSLQCPMGDLSNGSSGWWKELLQCLDRFYSNYLESSNITKLSLKPESFATAYLKEERWGRVDKRATSMILISLPEAVRAEILALRLSGTLAVLGRVMVLYRPGSTAERQQILKALEQPPVANNASEAVDALRRWARWLRRAGDIGLQIPDPSILLRGIDSLVSRVLFRINMARYTLEADVKPTLKAVESLHRALLSEFEQVAFRGRSRPTTTPTLRSAAASVPSLLGTPHGPSDNKGGDGSPVKGKAAPCKFFLTDQGCRRGAGCKYSHDADRKQKQGRCWTCGSKQHVSKQCPTREKPGRSPSRPSTSTRQEPSSPSSSLAAMAPESAHPVPPVSGTPTAMAAPASSSSTTSYTSNAQEPSDQAASSTTTTSEGELHRLLKEANSMLKEMRQLNMLTVRDVEVKAKSLGMEPATGKTGLLDSGASHAYRLGTPEELQAADKVRVQLATGDHVTLAQNRAGTLLATKSTDQDLASPIVPLGSLVQDLNCKLTWSRKRGMEIKHPIHGVIKPRVVGQCPLVGEAQALQLIKELEDKRVEDLQRANMVMQRTLWAWDRETRWSGCLENFLMDGKRTSQLQTFEAEGSPYQSLSTALKGALAECDAQQQCGLGLSEGSSDFETEEKAADDYVLGGQPVFGTWRWNCGVQGA